MEKIKLFCLPYAGGSATIYHQWKKYLHHRIQLCPVELAGRGKRFSENCYDSLADAVCDIYQSIKPELNTASYSFFGHSMGSILVYELVRKINALPHPRPVHLFLSGRYPPHIIKREKNYHQLPDDEFKSEIIKMGGTPPEVFEHHELLAIFLPLLRADYKIIETYQYTPEDLDFNCGITLFNGKADQEVSGDEMLEWRRYSQAECRLYEFEGGHFFIHEHMEDIVEIINNTLIKTG